MCLVNFVKTDHHVRVTADSLGTDEFQEGTVSVLLGDGDGGFADAQSFGTGLSPFGVALADLDGDGALDVVTANLDGSNVSVLINVSEPLPCFGDCNDDGQVSVAELVVGVNIALGNLDADQCPSFDAGGEGHVTIDDLLRGVNAALSGCRS